MLAPLYRPDVVVEFPGQGFVVAAHGDVVTLSEDWPKALAFRSELEGAAFLREQARGVLRWVGAVKFHRARDLAAAR